ncbi:DUF1571 domain-containing protein [Paraburkholderia sp.]|uniref:DUF1571 domain-containing protein n=1 Tax=Paraburkholderia sp. TaxID=1926495 RepID=UPI00238375B9|nr:DUF1571 domain-containing protein [Paraburkholderia sp.]MDE1184657.1 DUF1571 domain-containing protein [Paraburkholderia sp.]
MTKPRLHRLFTSLTCAVWIAAAMPAVAQSAASGPAAAGAAAPVAASALKPPTTPASQVGKLTLDQQVRWLRAAQQNDLLDKMDDAQLNMLFRSLDPLTVPRFVQEGPDGYPSYEFTMLRQERIKGQWPDKPDHMLVRIAHDPLRIYAKWLPDSPHAGQEVIYDESKRNDEMYGHLGGILGVMPIWTSITGSLARAQSNHEILDLGTEYVTTQFLGEGRKYQKAGVARTPQVDTRTIDGVRVVAFSYEAPSGPPDFYAKKEVLGLDLRHPYFRTVESYGSDGELFEKIIFQTITPKPFDDTSFDPKNPAYRF